MRHPRPWPFTDGPRSMTERAEKQAFASELARHPWFAHSGYEALP